MLEKGEISFIFLWILNPIMILFFQNCSMVHMDSASLSPQYVENRAPACHGPSAAKCLIPQ